MVSPIAPKKDYIPVQTSNLTALCKSGTPQEVLAAIQEGASHDEKTLETACARAIVTQPTEYCRGKPTEFATWIVVIERLIEKGAPITDDAKLKALLIDPALVKKMEDKQTKCTLM